MLLGHMISGCVVVIFALFPRTATAMDAEFSHANMDVDVDWGDIDDATFSQVTN